MKKLLSFLLFSSNAYCQACIVGSVTNNVQNTPTICTPVSMPVGTSVIATGLTAGMGTQTLCTTAANNGNIDPCPAGLYYVFLDVETVTPGTLVSSVTATASFTTDVRNYSNIPMQDATNISLVGTTPNPGFGYIFFKKAANTPLTIQTTANSFTGSPVYNLYARVIRIATN